ncbi:MAG: thiol peroxidase [Marinifilaceae bacterium]
MNRMEVTMHGQLLQLEGTPKNVGDKAPDFTAVDQAMHPIKLKDFKEKIIVITSFPSLDTPVCSAQVRHFNQMASDLSKDVAIICISCDLPFALSRFCAANGIERLNVVSDHKELSFGEQYGLVIKDLRLLARSVIVLDQERYIKYMEIVEEVTLEPDYDSALKAIKSLL